MAVVEEVRQVSDDRVLFEAFGRRCGGFGWFGEEEVDGEVEGEEEEEKEGGEGEEFHH